MIVCSFLSLRPGCMWPTVCSLGLCVCELFFPSVFPSFLSLSALMAEGGCWSAFFNIWKDFKEENTENKHIVSNIKDFPVAQIVKNLPAMQETRIRSLGQEDLLEKGVATHSSILAWRIPWTEEPVGLQSVGLQIVRHDWETNTHISIIQPQ